MPEAWERRGGYSDPTEVQVPSLCVNDLCCPGQVLRERTARSNPLGSM